MSERVQFVIDGEHAGMRLDQFVADQLQLSSSSITRSQVKTLIENGCILVDGKTPHKAGMKLSENQKIEISIPEIRKMDLTPMNLSIEILYEDEFLAVVNKPAGISVHPSPTENSPTLVHGLLHQLKSLSSVGGVERPGIVHRIDKGTSGILVVSKTDQAHLGLSKQFKDHTISRKYIALAFNDLRANGDRGRIETFYGRNPKDRKKMTGRLRSGKKAVTFWQVLKTFKNTPHLSLVECTLHTGRTHQIRVHLSEMGFPLVGDPIYSEHKKKLKFFEHANAELYSLLKNLDHQLLHAGFLEFTHPTTEKRMSFEKTLPSDFTAILRLLEQE